MAIPRPSSKRAPLPEVHPAIIRPRPVPQPRRIPMTEEQRKRISENLKRDAARKQKKEELEAAKRAQEEAMSYMARQAIIKAQVEKAHAALPFLIPNPNKFAGLKVSKRKSPGASAEDDFYAQERKRVKVDDEKERVRRAEQRELEEYLKNRKEYKSWKRQANPRLTARQRAEPLEEGEIRE